MKNENMTIEWRDSGREPKCKPDPAYPSGIDIDISNGQKTTCETDLPYPARRCGHFQIDCSKCGMSVLITTAGRPDDPRSIKIPCKGGDA